MELIDEHANVVLKSQRGCMLAAGVFVFRSNSDDGGLNSQRTQSQLYNYCY